MANAQLIPRELFDGFCSFLRRFLFQVLCFGPMPRHIAFILDGNRRYCKKWNLKQGEGHRIGFVTLINMLKYCHEMGVKYVSAYAFSIDNFNRKPDEVRFVMDLVRENTEALLQELSLVNSLGVRVEFLGDFKLLAEPIREAAKRAAAATAGNDRLVLLIYIAYTSSHEIVRAVQGSCEESWAAEMGNRSRESPITVENLERRMYLAGYPDPDILIRTSGETRLSNFLLWQTSFCFLYAPSCLWPEVSLRHLVWAILQYQRTYHYLENNKKKQF